MVVVKYCKWSDMRAKYYPVKYTMSIRHNYMFVHTGNVRQGVNMSPMPHYTNKIRHEDIHGSHVAAQFAFTNRKL